MFKKLYIFLLFTLFTLYFIIHTSRPYCFPPPLSSSHDPGGAVMKIHRRILTHYLSCTSPVDKEGYLYKKVRRLCVVSCFVSCMSSYFEACECIPAVLKHTEPNNCIDFIFAHILPLMCPTGSVISTNH